MSSRLRNIFDSLTNSWELYLLLFMAFVAIAAGVGKSIKEHTEEIAYRAMRAELSRCGNDCSGHRAGYAWAEENEAMSLDDCTGKSLSFINGCKCYVYDQMEADYQPDDPDPSPY